MDEVAKTPSSIGADAFAGHSLRFG